MIRWLKRHSSIFIFIVLLAGIGLMAYPTISNYFNTMRQTEAVLDYNKNVEDMSKVEREKMLRSARAYNRRLARSGFRWNMTKAEKKDYESQLDTDELGMMGYVTIPKIRVRDPIYHGTNEGTLAQSIGHFEPTSLPIGGKSTHSSLTGHRGVPSARLFTDLDQLEEGDIFTITVLGKTITYEVDKINIVLPANIKDFQLEQGRDYCTLITCTPYGVNTHRLLVRGHRIANLDGNANTMGDALQIRPIYIVPFLLAIFALLMLIILVICRRRAMRRADPEDAYLRTRGLDRPTFRDLF
jgi:sortase A